MNNVQGHSNLLKLKNNGVVNTDMSAYYSAKKRKEEKLKLESLENRLDRIEKLLERLINVN